MPNAAGDWLELVRVLMEEHREIEKTLALLEKEAQNIERSGKANSRLIRSAVVFFENYADRRHHGKEEAILFNRLAEKDMEDSDKKAMRQLLVEHDVGRKEVSALSEEAEKYEKNEIGALQLSSRIRRISALYRSHIEKEDMRFFPNCEKYFSSEEKNTMLSESKKFDASL